MTSAVQLAGRLLLVAGICVASIGAAGFHSPTHATDHPGQDRSTEKLAVPLFVLGLVLICAGGLAGRAAGRFTAFNTADHAGAKKRDLLAHLERVRNGVVELDDQRRALTGEALRTRIDRLLSGEFFDLVARREDLLALLGFTAYAGVWDGVATAERLLARAWSLATDGSVEEARAELPLARRHLERACTVMAHV